MATVPKLMESSVLSGSKSMMKGSGFGSSNDKTPKGFSTISTDIIQKYMFSLITEANHATNVATVMVILQYVILYCQVFFGAFFQFLSQSDLPNSIYLIQKILFFGFVGSVRSTIPFMIASISIHFLSILFLVFVIFQYQSIHEYKKWALVIIKYWHGCFYSYFIIPSLLLLAYSFLYYGENFDGIGVLLIILSILVMIYITFHTIVLLTGLARNPYISNPLIIFG